MSMPDDHKWMAVAARLARKARPLSRPNPAVACLIVREGRLLARGWTAQGGRPHAEAEALAALHAREEKAQGATLYVTLEPCAHRSERGPACADLVIQARPVRVVIGQLDPDSRMQGKGIERIERAGISVDVLRDRDTHASLAGYLMQAQFSRPFVTLKLAISSDGFIARENGAEPWITGQEARAHVHARRAMQDAILVGGTTWREDAPRLDVRLEGLGHRSPKRYVLTASETLEGVETLCKPAAIHKLSSIQYLYVEGGAHAAQAFLDADLVDRLDIYRAPITVGHGTKAPLLLERPDALERDDGWTLAQQCRLGSDHFTAYNRIK